MSDVAERRYRHGTFAVDGKLLKRNALLISMLVVATDVRGDAVLSLRLAGKLQCRLRDISREDFSGEDEYRPFRELAFDAATRVSAPYGARFNGWCAILREILRQLPECGALAE